MARSILHAKFEEHYPETWCIKSLEALNKCWTESKAYSRSMFFGPNEGRDLFPHDRRARFEAELRRVSNTFSGIEAESRPNIRRTASHTFVKSIGASSNLILTASSVQNPKCKPRFSVFRDQYNTNGQTEIYYGIDGLDKYNKADENNDIYAYFLYGSSDSDIPLFANIAFPSRDSKKYIEVISLIDLYPGIITTTNKSEENDIPVPTVQPIQIAPEEEIQKTSRPQIRPYRKIVGDGG